MFDLPPSPAVWCMIEPAMRQVLDKTFAEKFIKAMPGDDKGRYELWAGKGGWSLVRIDEKGMACMFTFGKGEMGAR